MKIKTFGLFFFLSFFLLSPPVLAQTARVEQIALYPNYTYRNKGSILVSAKLSLYNLESHSLLTNCTLYQEGRVLKWKNTKFQSTKLSKQTRWVTFVFPHQELPQGYSPNKKSPLKAEISLYNSQDNRLIVRSSQTLGKGPLKKKAYSPPATPKIWTSLKDLRVEKRYRYKNIEYIKTTENFSFSIEKKPTPVKKAPPHPSSTTPPLPPIEDLTSSLQKHPQLEGYWLDSRMEGEWLCFVLDESGELENPVVRVFYINLEEGGTGTMEISSLFFDSAGNLHLAPANIASIEILFWGVRIQDGKRLMFWGLEEEEDLWGSYQLLRDQKFSLFFEGKQKRVFLRKENFERIWPGAKERIKRELYPLIPYRTKGRLWRQRAQTLQREFSSE